ncbi:MgtC/SapB family protein [Streptomyces luteocolor]|uniref:MgtC/SapB family protein n=2 Tax=Streptomyces TaxID=1883 RepID=UPI0008535B8A|nr:MgtC/SapB family protein [Streptomyces luteocolor]
MISAEHLLTTSAAALFDPGAGQGARQFAELGLALVLSLLIGVEREARQRSAGMRTHTLVGVGSALFMEISVHGFGGAAHLDGVSFDPSRVAAQIVSGIGFIGGGLIFVKRDAVRGLTTAATIWLTCGIGMACGGGLPLLAVGATAVHFLVVRGLPHLTDRIAVRPRPRPLELAVTYDTEHGLLGRVLEVTTAEGFRVTGVRTTREEAPSGRASAVLRLEGTAEVRHLAVELGRLDGIRAVDVGAVSETTE